MEQTSRRRTRTVGMVLLVGTILYFALPLIDLTLPDSFLFFWRFYLVGLVTLGIGLWTFRVRPETEAAQFFALFTLTGAWSVGGIFDATTTPVLLRLWLVALSFVGVLHVLLTSVFPHEIGPLRRWPLARWLLLLPAIVVAIWAQWWLLREQGDYVVPWRAAYALNAAGLVGGMALLGYRSVAAASPLVQQQSRLLLTAALLAFAPIVVWFLTDSFDARFALVPLIIYPLAIGYTIIRYRLLDVNLVLRRSVTYALLFGGYAIAVILLSLTMRPVMGPDNPLSLLLLLLLILLTFGGLQRRLQEAVDRYFLRQPVAYEELLHRYNYALTEAMSTDQVAEALLKHTREGVPETDVQLYLPDSQWASYSRHADGAGPVVSAESPLVRFFAQEPGAIYLAEERMLPAELRNYGAELEALNAALVVPMISGGRLLAWLSISDKENGQGFDERELNYLNALADQSLLALERVNVIRHLETRVEEMNMLSQFSQALNFTIDFDILLELINTYCERILDINDFLIALRDRETDVIYTAFCLQDGRRMLEKEGQQAPLEDERALRVIETGQMLVTEDEERHAWMCAPLNAGAETLGALCARAPRRDESFQERQEQLFSVFADRAATALDRWMANQELQRRAEQLATLNEVTRSLTATLPQEELLELILDKAMELLDTEAGSFLMVEEDTGDLEFRVVRGPVSRGLVGTKLPIGTGISGSVAQTARPVIVDDVQHDRRWYDGVDASTEFVTHSSLTVPLLRQQEVIGVLQVINKHSGAPFDKDDQELLTAFAGQAVVAVETARLLEQTDQALQERVLELSLLQQLDRDLSTTLDLEQVTAITLDWSLRICEGTAGAIVLLDEEGSPYFQAVHGYDPSFEPATVTAKTIEAGQIGRALHSGKPQVTGNVQEEPGYIAAAFETDSQMSIPLVYKQEVIGAIVIESDEAYAFDPYEVERAIRVANHAATAIANALLYRQVIAANNAKSEFVSMVSHELKTPLTAIRGYTDLMLSGMTGEINEQQRTFLDTITRNISKTGRLIQDLTDISRIETGKLNVTPTPTSFQAIIDEAVQTAEGAYKEKDTQLHLDIPDELPQVMGDQHRLIQVVTNLLSNACKYSPAGADVYVTVREEEQETDNGSKLSVVYCGVRDTGYGISEEDQQKLFTKFFRSGDPNVRQAPGTGLGLSITKGIIELHGGRIWVDSVLGEGTTFHFTVPKAT